MVRGEGQRRKGEAKREEGKTSAAAPRPSHRGPPHSRAPKARPWASPFLQWRLRPGDHSKGSASGPSSTPIVLCWDTRRKGAVVMKGGGGHGSCRGSPPPPGASLPLCPKDLLHPALPSPAPGVESRIPETAPVPRSGGCGVSHVAAGSPRPQAGLPCSLCDLAQAPLAVAAAMAAPPSGPPAGPPAFPPRLPAGPGEPGYLLGLESEGRSR